MTLETEKCPTGGNVRLIHGPRWDPLLCPLPDPDPDEPPELAPALDDLAYRCGFAVRPERVGNFWVWLISIKDRPVPSAIAHDPASHDQRLFDFLTGYSLGMHHIPF
ncbi:hypothetical protein [Planctomyces sp. SH-PL14]|uniref:hypothetical protein n=1 Tax=Planctomyces sp. SH-PL14 TaxID=1632864 RepID=UPI00078E1857|nr:hypothetical protein [Planctomyces sp. SH-PL14]AMV16947.1 hypothetical protein VT03_03595 [Planctomyces sp. SH-PL14]